MSSTMMESEAVFKARAKAVGLPDDVLSKLETNGVNSMGHLAFVSGAVPGTHDDAAFVTVMKELLALDPIPLNVLAPLRRLFFEAVTMAVSEIKTKYERSDEGVTKKLPLPERETRRQDQQRRLIGLILEGNLEPAFSLVDAAHSIREEETVR